MMYTTNYLYKSIEINTKHFMYQYNCKLRYLRITFITSYYVYHINALLII